MVASARMDAAWPVCQGWCGGAPMLGSGPDMQPDHWRWECPDCRSWCLTNGDGQVTEAGWTAASAVARPDLHLFGDRYASDKVRFWLQHWLELQTLAEDASSSAGLAQELAREWELLQARRSDHWRPIRERLAMCLCRELHERGLGSSTTASSARGWGDARAGIKGVVADLLVAAEHLPTPWRATRRVFAQQQRSLEWFARYQRWRTGVARRAVDGQPEPADSNHQTARRMARYLAGQRHALAQDEVHGDLP